jgi:hypothetical protein
MVWVIPKTSDRQMQAHACRAEFKSHLVTAIKSEFKHQLAMNQKGKRH